MQYIRASRILLMSQGALTAPSPEGPKGTRCGNKARSWAQGKARRGGRQWDTGLPQQ